MSLNWKNLSKCLLFVVIPALLLTARLCKALGVPEEVCLIIAVLVGFMAMQLAMMKWEIWR